MNKILAAILFLFSSAAIADQYLCVVDAAAGFNYSKENSRWDSTRITPRKKFIISPQKEKNKTGYLLKQMGESNVPDQKCEAGFNAKGFLVCGQ